MKTAKKLLSVFMAAVILLSVPAFGFIASAVPVLPAINRVDITLRTDIAGKKFTDYKAEDVYTIETDNVHIPEGFMTLRIYKENGEFANRLVAGKKYQITVYAEKSPAAFYALGLEVYVNGQKLPSDSFGIVQSNNDLLWVDCGTYKITNNKDIFFLNRWINAILDFFEN